MILFIIGIVIGYLIRCTSVVQPLRGVNFKSAPSNSKPNNPPPPQGFHRMEYSGYQPIPPLDSYCRGYKHPPRNP